MDFKDFCNEKIEKPNTFKQKLSQKTIEQTMKNEIEKYSSYSQDQLMQELLLQTREKMNNGSLNNQKLDEMYNALKNVLPKENQEKLDQVFERIKK